MNIIDSITKLCSKEIREEDSSIRQILLTMLSAWSKSPQNTRILASSGEGKTYLVTQLAKLFPQENIVILAKATPQSFKYSLSSKKVTEIDGGKFEDYDTVLEQLKSQLKEAKNPKEKIFFCTKISEMKNNLYELIDFTHKVIIFVDSQSFELFESIKPILSHDQQHLKSFSVNKSKSGTMKGQKFVFKGFPAVIYCSAKNEYKLDTTNEISNRFNTITLNSSPKKYREMLKLEALRSSLPASVYSEFVMSDDDFKSLQAQIKQCIDDIQAHEQCWNPYGLGLQQLLKDDGGYRTRQLKTLNGNITIHTLANSKSRPKISYNGKTSPVTTRLDIEEACVLVKEPQSIQPYKIKFFNEHLKTLILNWGDEKQIDSQTYRVLTASQIVNFLKASDIPTDRQKLQETILKPLSDLGFLDEYQDPENRSRNVYGINSAYHEKDANLESMLIDSSILDKSCLDLFVNEHIKQRFESCSLKILDENDNVLTPKELLEILYKIDNEVLQNKNKIDSNDASTDIDGDTQ